ncbi:hypothetical protein [Streptomyces cinereoruber]|uniref:hypothetical protein n=1 Tax=Streptomyces cinereoruber TaxID=67260 RepID=UPI003668098D
MEQGPTDHPKLVRYFITLPEPLAIADGYTWHKAYDQMSRSGVKQFVHLLFLQSDGASRLRGSLGAALAGLHRVNGEPIPPEPDDPDVMTGSYTTVVASTLAEEGSEAATGTESPQDIPPETDPLTRCIDEMARFIRSYRTSLDILCKVPTYVELGPILPFQTGSLTPLEAGKEQGQPSFRISKWGDRGTLVLNNLHFPDTPVGLEIDEQNEGRLDYFRTLLDRGSPLFLWKERFVESRTAIYREGRYGQSVTLSNTACEVLLDALLGLMYWELGKSPMDVATLFAEGRLARRVKTNFSELLGGTWSLDGAGPVAEWFHQCYRLRHRVVHGGYSPTRLEAERALNSAFTLSEYCWDRIATKRKEFPRTALMTIAKEGLVKRGKWCRFMEEFQRDVAPIEPSWNKASNSWREEMHASLLSGS